MKLLSNEHTTSDENIVLFKDSDWSFIDGSVCRVLNFIPMGAIEGGKIKAINKITPYASIVIENKKLPKKVNGFITHKIDFKHLWLAFKERGIKDDEEVNVIWTRKHYKNAIYKILSFAMPKLWVMICKKGAYESMIDPNFKPELQGETRYMAEKAIIDWKPEVMK